MFLCKKIEILNLYYLYINHYINTHQPKMLSGVWEKRKNDSGDTIFTLKVVPTKQPYNQNTLENRAMSGPCCDFYHKHPTPGPGPKREVQPN